jgi:2-methylisocitrate lyase-like PEP mutase family enzyme
MGQAEKAARFAELHVTDKPLLLFKAWDAGSAKAILGAGATAIATSSWSITEAQGYRDGEDIPIALAEQVIARIAAAIDAPVSADFEGGYSEDNGELAETARLIGHGIVGINIEDRVVKGTGLYDVNRRAGRISAIRAAVDQKEVDLSINARTDLALGQGREPVEAVEPLPNTRARREHYAKSRLNRSLDVRAHAFDCVPRASRAAAHLQERARSSKSGLVVCPTLRG